MTRKEAIKRLKEVRFNIQPYQYINEALDMAIQALGQEPKTEWISVVVGDPTTLPKPDENVLVQYGSSMYVVHRFVDTYLKHTEDDDDSGWYSEQGEYLCTFYEIDAWQPLPNSYKKSEVGE